MAVSLSPTGSSTFSSTLAPTSTPTPFPTDFFGGSEDLTAPIVLLVFLIFIVVGLAVVVVNGGMPTLRRKSNGILVPAPDPFQVPELAEPVLHNSGT